MRPLALLVLAACTRSVPPPVEQHASAPPPFPAAELCCCKWTNPSDHHDTQHYEARRSACIGGTPAMPAGVCDDWSACGFPSGAHRTVADRADLASTVAVPPGSCCCDADAAFRIVPQASCTGTCLDADWCTRETTPPARPQPSGIEWIDRCVEVADHFEPWRKNPHWANEVSPRTQLIADCQAQRWSAALQECLLEAGGPLELDGCIGVK
jgi:hypothetical protein